IVKKPWIFYEFNLLDGENNETRYDLKEKQKENRAKMKDELEIYEEYLQKDLKHTLNSGDIVVGYNPILQNLIHRFKVLYADTSKFNEFKRKIDKLHKPYNQINIYLHATPNQIIQRQPENYSLQLL